MKKLVSLFTMVFAISMAIAQEHTDIINQVGDDNVGTVWQAGAESNLGQIYTTGNDNDALIWQHNNGFGGAGLDALVNQNGNNNHAYVDQAHWKPGAGLGSAFGHDAEIDQDGNWNDADIYQFNGQPSDAYIRQLGNENDADQVIWSDGTGASSAYIWQQGNKNIADQNLGISGYVAGSSFSATQVGSDNKSYQYIYSGEPFPAASVNDNASNNNGTVATYGNNNYAEQKMFTNGDGDVIDNTATITQYNNWNKAWQSQTGFGHTSTIYQNGFGNEATSVQN